MTQTAVEWLTQQVKSKEWQDMFIWHKEEIFKQAKQMEKEQIIEAFDCDGSPQPGEIWISNGEQYYSETYGKTV